MSDATIALILAGVLGSPIFVAIVQSYLARHDRRTQWERDDEVARRVMLVAKTVEETAFTQGEQLAQIHGLVNSNLTTALESELAAIKAMLVVLKADNKEASTNVIAVAEARVAELEAQLADRRAL